jgi:hypothetical protein
VKLFLHDEEPHVASVAPSFETFIDSLEIDPEMI